jgi:hypothetical protein
MDHEQLLELALVLLLEQRAELARRLIEGLDTKTDDGVDAAWVEEMQRRLERFAGGETPTHSNRMHGTGS